MMKKMKKSLVLIPMLLLAFSCSHQPKGSDTSGHENTTLITGKLDGGNAHKLYVQSISSNHFKNLDTLEIGKDDRFSVWIGVGAPDFYALRNEDGKAIIFVAHGGQDTVNVESQYQDFRDFTLTGSEDLEQLTLLNQKTQDFLRKMDVFAQITTDSVKSPNYTQLKTGINQEYQEAFAGLRDFSEKFIERNNGSLITLLALSNQLGPQFYVFDPVKDIDLFRKTDSVLFANYPANEPVIALHNEVIAVNNQIAARTQPAPSLSPGSVPPEINLPSPGGKYIKLSSTRGKIVLLDFWASWCPPCRRENPNLVANYQKYHSRGFEIFQVSLDQHKDYWESAIRDDHLDWIHVSDLRYWNSSVVPLYHITSIPTNYLLDRNGKIMASNLRGEELSQKLDEIFNH